MFFFGQSTPFVKGLLDWLICIITCESLWKVETTYDMSICSLVLLMKTTYSLYKNNLNLFYRLYENNLNLFYHLLKHLYDKQLCYKCSIKQCI